MKEIKERVRTDCMFLSCHYAFQSESTLYSCLNVKELLVWSRHVIWSLSDCNWTQNQNHLVHRRTLNHLAKLPNGWVFIYELCGSGFESSCRARTIKDLLAYLKDCEATNHLQFFCFHKPLIMWLIIIYLTLLIKSLKTLGWQKMYTPNILFNIWWRSETWLKNEHLHYFFKEKQDSSTKHPKFSWN